jgi:hypothetical protein
MKSQTRRVHAISVNSLFGDYDWTSINNILSSTETEFSACVMIGANSTSYILELNDFRFDIPSDAKITGIVLTIGQLCEVGNPSYYVNTYSLRFSGRGFTSENVGNEDHWKTGTVIPFTTFEKVEYGSPVNLWGVNFAEKMTPEEINRETFGFELMVFASNNATAYINSVEATVYYQESVEPTGKREKNITVKVYDETGKYINTWHDIISEISFNNEINTAGGQLQLTLARNAGDYGEGTDIDFKHRVKVFITDYESPLEKLIFQGYISAYTPIYKDNNVEVTCLSYGEELNSFMIEGGSEITIAQTTEEVSYMFGNYHSFANTAEMAQTIKATGNETWSRIVVKSGAVGFRNVPLRLNIYKFVTNIATSIAGSLLATASTTVDFTEDNEINLAFNEPLKVTTDQTYVFHFFTPTDYAPGADNYPCSLIGANSNKYVNGSLYLYATGFTWADTSKDLFFRLYKTSTLTRDSYLSKDPSDILRAVMNNYRDQGGVLDYDEYSLEDTGTKVSYTFNMNTTLEGVNKCLELAPQNWYWAIDYGTNLIHFHQKNVKPDHVFSLEKDIIDAKFEKRIEDIVNIVYFSGGDVGGTNLFKKYVQADSVALYGRKALKYSDQRVTVPATADIIANTILANRSQPELRVTLTILDSNNSKNLGYDIESIKVGDVIAVRNVSNQVALSSWDISRWDNDYWDFNIQQLSSLQMQVQKLDYTPDILTIYASTLQVDVNKRIEDINRNLEILQTINNPDTPA